MRKNAGELVQAHLGDGHDVKAKAKAVGSAAWDATRAAYDELQDKTMACTQATGRAIRGNPYISISVAFGLGMLAGMLVMRRNGSD